MTDDHPGYGFGFMALEEIAAVCARANLGEYGVHGALIHRLAFELGVVHAALHAALARDKEAPQ